MGQGLSHPDDGYTVDGKDMRHHPPEGVELDTDGDPLYWWACYCGSEYASDEYLEYCQDCGQSFMGWGKAEQREAFTMWGEIKEPTNDD